MNFIFTVFTFIALRPTTMCFGNFFLSSESSGGSESNDGNVAVRQIVSKKKKNPLVQSVSSTNLSHLLKLLIYVSKFAFLA